MQKLNNFQAKYYNFLILTQLPFYALASSITYKKYRYNFAELLTLQTFITAQATVISMILMSSTFVTGETSGTMISLMGFITAGFQVFALMQFFAEKSAKGFFRALLANIMGIIFFMVFIALGVFVYAIVTKVFFK